MRRQTAFAFALAFAVVAAGLGVIANAGPSSTLVVAQGAAGLVALVIGALIARLAPDPRSWAAVVAGLVVPASILLAGGR